MGRKETFAVSMDSKKEKPQNVEDVLEALGGFGKFQFMVLVLMLAMEIPCAFLVFVPVFIGATPEDWLCNNLTISKADACECMGELTAVDPTASIVAEWGLLCESSWVADTIISLQMSGMMFGNIIISQLSDWYGRKYCYLGIVLQMLVGSVMTAAAPNPYVYAAARFICGSSFSGFLSLSAIYSMEFLTPKWRPVASAVGPFGEAIMLLGLVASYIQPWRTLVWATCIPFLAIVITFPFIPESPRWLLRNNKVKESYEVLAHIGRLNGRPPVDEETLQFLADKERPQVQKEGVDGEVKIQQYTFLEFYRGYLRKTTLCLQGIWFAWGLVYFGISYNIKNLAGNPYLNVVYMGLMDSISYKASFFVNNCVGRRKSLVSFMTFSAIFLVCIAILELSMDLEGKDWLVATLCFLGKFGTGGARSAARTLTGESYPTAIRVMGIGFAGVTGSFGAMLAPQFAYLGVYWPSVPFFAFAIISVGGSLVSFLLTETHGQPLQEEIATKNKKLTFNNDTASIGVSDGKDKDVINNA